MYWYFEGFLKTHNYFHFVEIQQSEATSGAAKIKEETIFIFNASRARFCEKSCLHETPMSRLAQARKDENRYAVTML